MQINHATLIAVVLSSFAIVQAQQPAPATKPAAPASHGQGEKPSPPSMHHASNIGGADRNFMTKAAADGHNEIELAKVAEQKAASSEVKALAQRLQKDHAEADQELRSLAQSKGVTLSAPPDHSAEMAKLEKLAGESFDRTYSNMMVTDHKNAIALFERAGKSSDAEVKAFAEKTLPALREHLKMAQDALASVKTSGSTSTNTPSPTTRPSPDRPPATSTQSTTKPPAK